MSLIERLMSLLLESCRNGFDVKEISLNNKDSAEIRAMTHIEIANNVAQILGPTGPVKLILEQD